MRWDEVDWDKRLWIVPKERMKGGREHTVPLSDRVMEILRLQRQYSNGGEYVFSGYKRTRLAEKAMVGQSLSCSAVGSPEMVEAKLKALIAETGADELMTTGQIYDHAARLRSFEIAAEVRDRLAKQPAV